MIEELKDKLAKAAAKYANCGCTVYLDEMNQLKEKIKKIENG